jgi:hypothetical protein
MTQRTSERHVTAGRPPAEARLASLRRRLAERLPAVGLGRLDQSGRAQAGLRRAGGTAASARPGSQVRRSRHPATFRFILTTRGAILGLFALYLAVFLVAAWSHAGVLAGVGFCAGAVLAPCYLRREAQLQIAVAVPAIALAATVLCQIITAQGDSGRGAFMSVLEGIVLTLGGLAPWLFAGTAACLAVACYRGLPQCVRDLVSSLRFEGEPARQTSERSGYGSPLG